MEKSHGEIVLLRHGNSEWTEKNLFCGWYDSPLCARGIEEAKWAGSALKERGYEFDMAFTSQLRRARDTLATILEDLGAIDTDVVATWRLNERHYGDLTGLDKAETAAKYGEDQVRHWRRSFSLPPPPISEESPWQKSIVEGALNHNQNHPQGSRPSVDQIPRGESLQMAMGRVIPFWQGVILPQLQRGNRVLVVAHGSSLRGIVKHVEELSDEEIMEVNLPTGIPFVYQLDENLRAIQPRRFLANDDIVQKAIQYVLNQGKAIKSTSKYTHMRNGTIIN